jgi:hypothetical protein
MNKKTQTVGKPPRPYPRTFEDFQHEAALRIRDFEAQPIGSGPFAGRSPLQCYHDHLEKGWQPVSVDLNALDAAFCERIERRVDRGSVSIGSNRFRHPELPNGRRVAIAMPFRRGAYPLVQLPELGWAYLEPEMLHLPGEISGAIESGRMQRRNVRRVSDMRRQAGTIDLRANIDDRVAALPTRAAPAPLIDVMLSTDAMALADARVEAEQKRLAAPGEAERRAARLMAETEELERYLASKRA